MKTKYGYSDNEDKFNNTFDYDTREEAILEAIRELDSEVEDIIFVGEATPYIPSFYAKKFLEDQNETAYEQLGDFADGWPSYTVQQTQELQEKIGAVFQEWLIKTNNIPTFYHIISVKEVEVTRILFDMAHKE